ncbi:hypothetical protein [Sediminitomix flava]|uniref:Uncharacterized protein n=1 Tax=Sediminitomix flava TaxID=379075 RepID=A0A315YVD3_SEDFL|nr:hypothetical protein [Sediminitomix flava]PWJ32686.1 hypothetical protein BC781_1204 [Sediminitomix flava]
MKVGKYIFWGIFTLIIIFGLCLIFKELENYLPSESLSFALLVNFLLMFWFDVTVPKLKLKYDLSYFEVSVNERNIYKVLGIELYKKILKISGWEKFTNSKNPPLSSKIIDLRGREYLT